MKNGLSLLILVGVLATISWGDETGTGGRELASPMARARQFVSLLRDEDFARASGFFDDELGARIPSEKLEDVWRELIEQVGPCKGELKMRQDQLPQYVIVVGDYEFEQKPVAVKMVFNRGGQMTGLWFVASGIKGQVLDDQQVPPYVAADSFVEQEVVIGNEEWELPGTVTIPVGAEPFAAVVLVHDVGTLNRGETAGANRPFRDLAWGLASKGIVVLRYKNRTMVLRESGVALAKDFTVREEVISDVVAAISVLSHRDDVDPDRIFVLGHGLGGMLAPRIEKARSDVAGLIVMAGMTRSLEEVYFHEKSHLFSLDGDVSPAEEAELKKIKRQMAMLRDEQLSQRDGVPELLLGRPVSYWLDIRQYHPGVAASKLSRPMLILQGGRDYRSTLEDFRGWRTHLSGRENVEFKLYLRLNHVFMPGKGASKSDPEEHRIHDYLAQKVIEDIAEWIKKQPTVPAEQEPEL